MTTLASLGLHFTHVLISALLISVQTVVGMLYSHTVEILWFVVVSLSYCRNNIGIISHAFNYTVPSLSFLFGFGALSLFTFIMLVLTGLSLTFLSLSSMPCRADLTMYLWNTSLVFGMLESLHATLVHCLWIILTVHMIHGLAVSNNIPTVSTILMCAMVLSLFGICFLGYIIPFGNMSLWGMAVITSSLLPIDSVLAAFLGSNTVQMCAIFSPRIFLLHFLLPLVMLVMVLMHLLLLHRNGSTTTAFHSAPSELSFTPVVLVMDVALITIVMSGIIMLTLTSLFFCSHPDNNSLPNILSTPGHILPEWYFLPVYALLKSLPNFNAGLIGAAVVIFISMSTVFIGSSDALISVLLCMVLLRSGSLLSTSLMSLLSLAVIA